jgi:hypothetical protein
VCGTFQVLGEAVGGLALRHRARCITAGPKLCLRINRRTPRLSPGPSVCVCCSRTFLPLPLLSFPQESASQLRDTGESAALLRFVCSFISAVNHSCPDWLPAGQPEPAPRCRGALAGVERVPGADSSIRSIRELISTFTFPASCFMAWG